MSQSCCDNCGNTTEEPKCIACFPRKLCLTPDARNALAIRGFCPGCGVDMTIGICRCASTSADKDSVNHPSHYNNSRAKCECGRRIECIDVTRHLDFNIGNAMKYLWRFADKNGLEDLKKARWYLDDFIRMLEGRAGKEIIEKPPEKECDHLFYSRPDIQDGVCVKCSGLASKLSETNRITDQKKI